MFYAIYTGPIWLNKASDQQKQSADQNQAFTTKLQNDFGTEFGNSQNIQGALTGQLNQILAEGKAGQGFQPGEEAALRTDSTERAAQQSTQAQQALGATLASHGEGAPMTSGNVASQAERIASGAAASDANAQRGITERNSELARSNVETGLQGLGQLSGQEGSMANGLAGAGVTSGANSYEEETQAHQPSGMVGSLLGGLASMIPYVGPAVGKALTGAINGPNTAGALGKATMDGNSYTQSLQPDDNFNLGDIEE